MQLANYDDFFFHLFYCVATSSAKPGWMWHGTFSSPFLNGNVNISNYELKRHSFILFSGILNEKRGEDEWILPLIWAEEVKLLHLCVIPMVTNARAPSVCAQPECICSIALCTCVRKVCFFFPPARLQPHLHSRQSQAIGQGDLDVPRTSLTFATI